MVHRQPRDEDPGGGKEQNSMGKRGRAKWAVELCQEATAEEKTKHIGRKKPDNWRPSPVRWSIIGKMKISRDDRPHVGTEWVPEPGSYRNAWVPASIELTLGIRG